MQLDLHSISEKKAGRKWQKRFRQHWPSYKKWYLTNKHPKGANLQTCRARLKEFMPEFYPTYLELCALSGTDTVAHRFLTGYCPPPFISGCAQIVNEQEAQLIRNYDYDPLLSEGTLFHSKWSGHGVIVMGDCLIGAVDGMNESGLVVSLTFGGRKALGDGFGIPFILRYILEHCHTLEAAVNALKRIPSHMSYNIMLMNKLGEHKLVQVAPDHLAIVTELSASTNHQKEVDWPEHATFTKTIERELYLQDLLAKGEHNSDQIANAFLKAPLFNRKYKQGFGTIYTAVYKPKEGSMELRWPGVKLKQSFKKFQEGITTISYSESLEVSNSLSISASQLQADYNDAVETYWIEYARGWASDQHEAAKMEGAISQRITDLLQQMELVSKIKSSYPWQNEVKKWTRVPMKK